MAQLKDTIVSGNLRVTDTTLTDTLQVTTIKAPTSSGGTTYGPGTSGQVLKSNGSSVYWTSDSNTDEKVKSTKLAQSTAEASYYPTLVTGAGTAGVSIFDSAKINHTPGTTLAVGNTRLILGNATNEGTANNEEGLLRIYSSGTKYHTLQFAKITNDHITHTFPTTGGTILNTGNYTSYTIPFAKVTGSADADTYAANTGWYDWNTTSGTNMPTENWGILLSKGYPSVQMFLPDTGTAIYLRKKEKASTAGTSWMGITGTAGNTYNLNNFLPLSGGTMEGNISFKTISGNTYPIASNKIIWNGGTDGIDIYYNLRADDAGELIMNMRDDTNVRISFAHNGTVKSYIDTNGNFSGNAATATSATKSYKLIQNGTTRPTTANIACVGDQSVSLMQVSSSMTIGQPAGEGYILNFDWDTTSSWQSQLFIPIKYLTPPAYRAQNNNSAWADTNQWVNILTDKFGAGKDGYISFPGDGSYTASQENVTGGLVITLPFGMTSIMMTFVIDIFDYRDGDTVSYRVAGFNYDSNSKWYHCTAICIGKYGSLSSNLTVRFGHNGTKAQIQIGETTTAWKWPQVRIRDILLGHNATQGNKTYLSNKTGWTISFVTTNISNISQTITNTHIGYNCVEKATLTVDESSDFASYPWHKFASITCDAGNGDYNLTLLVSKTWGSYGTNTGILTVHIRTTDTKIYGTSHFGWLLKGTDITANNFKLLYTNTANTKTEIELWYKQESRYDGWIFTVLSESNRATFTNKWVTYKNWGHGSASLPTATGTVTSSILNISNNAATATTATKAYNVAKNPSTTTTYAISFGGAGESGVEEPTNGTFTTGAKDHYVNDGLGYRTREGVANGTEGLSALVLGNSLASSVANNKTGYVRQYSVNKYYTDLKPNTLTASRTILLPDAAGTIAVFPAARTSGQVVVTDGTAGAVKTSGYTIAKSVPSNAVFTDTKVTQTITTASNDSYRPILVGMDHSGTNLPTSYTGTTKTDTCYATHKVLIQPSTGDIYATSLTLKSASTGSVTLEAASQTTSGTYYLPACGNGTYTLSIGMTQVGGTGDSLVMSNISGIPSGTLSFKIIFRSNASLPIYSMVEIPNIGDGVDCGGLIQVGDYTDGQQGSLRIVMKSVVIRVTAGSTTGTKTFTATVSPTQKISGSSVSEFTRNVIMYKIYACC